MSVPARQTTNVDLMRDDPERLLDVSEAAALLHVKNKTLYAWVSRNKILIARSARSYDFIVEN